MLLVERATLSYLSCLSCLSYLLLSSFAEAADNSTASLPSKRALSVFSVVKVSHSKVFSFLQSEIFSSQTLRARPPRQGGMGRVTPARSVLPTGQSRPPPTSHHNIHI